MTHIFLVQREPWDDKYSIKFGIRSETGKLDVAQPIMLTMVPEGELSPNAPMLSTTEQGVQSLMDALWNAGVRPSEIGTAGHLAATQSHLSDMRKLVEKTLDIKL